MPGRLERRSAILSPVMKRRNINSLGIVVRTTPSEGNARCTLDDYVQLAGSERGRNCEVIIRFHW